MRRILLLFIVTIAAITLSAQEEPTRIEARGDLNKDGISDMVVVTTDSTRTVLSIYFGTTEGQQQLWKTYDNVIPIAEDENTSIDTSLEITAKGVLLISWQIFASMGGWESDRNSYYYRYQNGDFYLIGYESRSLQRNTGDMETISENYLTWKRQVVKENAMDDSAPKKEKWTRLAKRPLKKL